MGKHKNAEQNSAMVLYMEEHSDMARGHTKGDRVEVDTRWRLLADSLNALGPPVKDANGWKKTWTDWKCEVRKKLAHNRREGKATGGGPFSQYTLSEMEETLARVSGIFSVVERVSNIPSFGPPEEFTASDQGLNNTIDDAPSTSRSCGLQQSSATPNTLRRQQEPSLQAGVKTFMATESTFHSKLSKQVEDLVAIGKENRSSLKRVYRSIEKMSDTLAGIKEDFKEHNGKLLKVLEEKNAIKARQLEIEEIKITIKQNQNKRI